MTVTFERTTIVPARIERVFDVSLDVDFHLRSFQESGESVIGGVRTGGMHLGDDVTWRARHFGIWWTMTSVITEFDRPRYFVNEQRRGPFKRFRHEHRFTEHGETAHGESAHGESATSMVDVVTFDAPFGPLGRLVERLLLGAYLAKLIDRRNAELLAVLTPRDVQG